MGRRKTFRKKIKQPDELVSTTEQVMDYVKENPARVGMIAVTAVLVIGVILGSWKYVGYRETKILKLESEAFELYKEAREDKVRIPDAQGKLEAVYEEYPGTLSGQTSLYHAANLYYLDGDYEKAREQYSILAEKHGGNMLLYPLALQNLAYTLEQLEDYNQALGKLEMLVSIESDVPVALVHADMARIYEKLGDNDKAVTAWQEIVDSYPDSPWAEQARERLGLPPVEEGD